MQDILNRLRDLVDRHATGAREPTALPHVAISKGQATPEPVSGLYTPLMALVLQGAKEVTIGDRHLRYDPASYFIASLELPASGCMIRTKPGEPYLAVSLDLEADSLAPLLADTPPAPDATDQTFAVNPVTPDLLDAWLRLLRLLDAPQDIAVLAPLIEREILYRLLQGPQGGVLRQITQADSRLSRVRRAITLIRTQFARPLRVEALADHASMSLASLHRHFKAATAMSPLQYQKSLRLQEARRLLVSGRELSAVAYAVGYESLSQFSREYGRMFGAPPSKDAARWRVLSRPERRTPAAAMRDRATREPLTVQGAAR